ncbi:hypothetical protein AB0L20_31815, partial [Streptomyces albidoflavus]
KLHRELDYRGERPSGATHRIEDGVLVLGDCGISKSQYAAGTYFGGLYRAAGKVKGWRVPNIRSIGGETVSSGFYSDDELDLDRATSPEHARQIQDRIDEVKRNWADMYRAIMDADRNGGDVFEALKRTLLEDLDPRSQAEIGSLRTGLNAINHMRGVR